MEINSTARGGLAAHIRAHLSELRDTEARVAQVVLDKGAELVHLSVSDVATLAGTAPSSVVRACQRLGFRGYQELKIAAARQAPAQEPSRDRDPAARALADTVRAAREALDGVAATVTPERLRAAAELIGGATRVLVVGAGLSGAVVLDTAYRLRALGCAVDAPADPLTAQLAASQLTPPVPAWPSVIRAPRAARWTPPGARGRQGPASSPSPVTPVRR